MKKLFLLLLLAFAAAVAVKEMRRPGALMNRDAGIVNHLPRSSPLWQQQQDFVDRFNADPKLRERFAGEFTSKGLYAELEGALRRGAQSLDGPSLVKMTRAMSAMVPRLPEHSCAKLMRPQDDFDPELSADIDAALANLPPLHHRNLYDFYLRALQAEVTDAPIRPRDREYERIALQQLGGNYQGREAERLLQVLGSPATASDADACWAIKTMTHGTTLLEPQSAAAMSRLIWAGEGG